MSFTHNIDKALELHKHPDKRENFHNILFGDYISDMVYGSNDGIITTFAVVAGVSGAGLNTAIVIVLGLANLLADGVSMAAGNYLGSKSELDYRKKILDEETWEIENIPECERKEIKEIYREKGFEGQDLARAVEIITSDKKRWINTMMHEEHGFFVENTASLKPIKKAAATLVAFICAGGVPLIPYVFLKNFDNLFLFSIIFTGVTLFIVGSLRTIFTKRSIIRSGMEMLIVGSVTAGIAYFIGEVLKNLIK